MDFDGASLFSMLCTSLSPWAGVALIEDETEKGLRNSNIHSYKLDHFNLFDAYGLMCNRTRSRN